jgi:Na+/H+-dicarboxylate symporter
MEKVALLSGTVVCLFFVLGAISTKIENRRRSGRATHPVAPITSTFDAVASQQAGNVAQPGSNSWTAPVFRGSGSQEVLIASDGNKSS